MAAATLVAVMVVSAPAAAQVESGWRPEEQEPRLRRVVGFGTTIGVGGGVVSTGGGFLGAGLWLLLPTLEALIYVDESTSIDVSIPVGNLVVGNIFSNLDLFTATIYVDFSMPIAGEDVRLIGGPGLGFSVASGGANTAGSVRIAALLGTEFVTFDRLFAFRLMTRPVLEIAFDGSSTAVGGGAMLELGFDFFVTTGD